jgi:hypothetical protein
MKRSILSYIPGLSHVHYEDNGCKIDRLKGLSEERITEKHFFHFNYMMVWAAIGVFYLSAGLKYDEWNPVRQGMIVREKVTNLLEHTLGR